VAKQLEVSKATCHRWRAQHGGLKAGAARLSTCKRRLGSPSGGRAGWSGTPQHPATPAARAGQGPGGLRVAAAAWPPACGHLGVQTEPQLGVRARGAIGPAATSMDRTDLLDERLVRWNFGQQRERAGALEHYLDAPADASGKRSSSSHAMPI
jgi:hypothetical protein